MESTIQIFERMGIAYNQRKSYFENFKTSFKKKFDLANNANLKDYGIESCIIDENNIISFTVLGKRFVIFMSINIRDIDKNDNFSTLKLFTLITSFETNYGISSDQSLILEKNYRVSGNRYELSEISCLHIDNSGTARNKISLDSLPIMYLNDKNNSGNAIENWIFKSIEKHL